MLLEKNDRLPPSIWFKVDSVWFIFWSFEVMKEKIAMTQYVLIANNIWS